MAVQIQLRRGTTAEHSSFTGVIGEITMDTTKNVVVVHNGSLLGGFPLALASGSAITAASLLVNNNLNISSGNAYQINGTSVLNATTLGSGVLASSLTSVGTLSSLTVSGNTSLALSSGGVGIGVAAGSSKLNVAGSFSKNTGDENTWGIRVTDETAMTAGVGGGLVFVGNYTSGGAKASFASIAGAKTNSTTANGLGELRFYTTDSSSVLQQRAVIDGAGNLAVDTNTLYVDAANNRVGIGTASPVGPLDVADGTNPIITIRNTAQKNWNTDDAIGYLDYRIDDTSASGARTVAYVRSLVDTGVSNGVTVASNLIFGTGAYDAAASEKMRLDASGNLGLGVTPPTQNGGTGYWLARGTLLSDGASLYVTHNAYYNSAWKYTASNYASYYLQTDTGQHQWAIAPSGTANNNATFTTAMTLDSSGNLGLGVTPSAWAASYNALQFGTSARAAALFTNGANDFWSVSNTFFNGTNFVYYANGAATAYNQANGSHSWRSAPSGTAGNTLTGANELVTRMTLDASGNLGVGATSPSANYRLTVQGVGTAGNPLGGIAFRQGATDVMLMGNIDLTNSTDFELWNPRNGYTRFGTNNTERARITSGGYFKASNTGGYDNATGTYHELLNNDTDDYILVATHFGASNPNGIALQFTAASPDNNTQVFLRCADNTTARCIVYSDGDLANHDGVYGTLSDERLKQDIVDAGSQWDDLKAVRFRKYRMKSDVKANPDAPFMLGVVAQELEQTSPGLVDEHPDFEEQEVTDEDGNVTTEKVQVGTTKSVKSSILLMKAAVALQEAMARIEALEARLEALEA